MLSSTDLSSELAAKRTALELQLRALGRTLVAYSGGVDSAFLAWAAHQVLGDGMLAVIADSPSLARAELARAISFAERHRIPLEVVATHEIERAEYVRNDSLRCFHCKDELFGVMQTFCRQRGFDAIAYGLNVDDQGDFRPGQRAAESHHVAAPLVEAGLSKSQIRELARQAGLEVWDKPASACLSSRIEYGRPVTLAALRAVEQGEEALRRLGFRQFRVRHHGDIVRLEIDRSELERALNLEMISQFSAIFKSLGFKFVTLDVDGFRSGSMNALLSPDQLTKQP